MLVGSRMERRGVQGRRCHRWTGTERRTAGEGAGEGAALAPRRTRRGVPEVHLACTGCYPNRDLELDPDHKRDSPVAAFPFLLPKSAGVARHARGARRKHSAVGAAADAGCRGPAENRPPPPLTPPPPPPPRDAKRRLR
ncbi:uncharacterized protein LOC142931072 isoform X3 [Petromyzon marinus]|uniref:uncharacterized protein LOC142931072 isoform X3 n=1 Tax=Petromyzon marinus TaxID=7757 RepID=UPI003F6EBF0B